MKSLKSLDLRGNIGYILYLIVVNFYILWIWLRCFSISVTSEAQLSIGSSTLSTATQAIGGLLTNYISIMSFIVSNIILFVLLIIFGFVFNKFYFKEEHFKYKTSRIKDIQILTLIISVLFIILILLSLGLRLFPLLFTMYILYTLLIYILVQIRINNAYILR